MTFTLLATTTTSECAPSKPRPRARRIPKREPRPLPPPDHNLRSESEWPTGPDGAVPAKSFDSPRAPVHVVTGAGGAPAFGAEAPTMPTTPTPAAERSAAAPAFTRRNIFVWSYSVVEAFNSSHLLFQQLNNSDSSVVDNFLVVQPKHGKFAV